MRSEYTRVAIKNLSRIRNHIAKDNPAAAERQVTIIEDAVKQLLENPMMGPRGRITGTRMLVRAPYIIHYRVERDRVVILRIRHGRQRPL